MTTPDDYDPADDEPLLIDFECRLVTTRIIGSSLLPTRLRLRASVLPGRSDDADQGVDQGVDLAVAKIRFWFDAVVARAVALACDNESAHAMLFDPHGGNRCSNPIMLCPEEPTDAHLAALFLCKMNALAGAVMQFSTVELKSDDMNGLVFTCLSDAVELPEIAAWVGEPRYFDQPWWHRDDASTLDVSPPAGADLSHKPAWAYKLSFLNQAFAPPAPEQIILRPKFTPTIIDGGRAPST